MGTAILAESISNTPNDSLKMETVETQKSLGTRPEKNVRRTFPKTELQTLFSIVGETGSAVFRETEDFRTTISCISAVYTIQHRCNWTTVGVKQSRLISAKVIIWRLQCERGVYLKQSLLHLIRNGYVPDFH